ncbi:hypothetical protein Pelo_12652 [Pelomyxa schiedti]|nr:hypothetical protein Pelo_12652 [Pelomyxa schiedti]
MSGGGEREPATSIGAPGGAGDSPAIQTADLIQQDDVEVYVVYAAKQTTATAIATAAPTKCGADLGESDTLLDTPVVNCDVTSRISISSSSSSDKAPEIATTTRQSGGGENVLHSTPVATHPLAESVAVVVATNTRSETGTLGESSLHSGVATVQSFFKTFLVDSSSKVSDLSKLCHSKFSQVSPMSPLSLFALYDYCEDGTDVYFHKLDGDLFVLELVNAAKGHWRTSNHRLVLFEEGCLLKEEMGFQQPTKTTAPPFLKVDNNDPSNKIVPCRGRAMSTISSSVSFISRHCNSSIFNHKKIQVPSSSPLDSQPTPPTSTPLKLTQSVAPTLPPKHSTLPTCTVETTTIVTGYYLIQVFNKNFLCCGMASKGNITLASTTGAGELWFVTVKIKPEKKDTQGKMFIALRGSNKLWLKLPKGSPYPTCSNSSPKEQDQLRATYAGASSRFFLCTNNTLFIGLRGNKLVYDVEAPSYTDALTFSPVAPPPAFDATTRGFISEVLNECSLLVSQHRLEEALQCQDLLLSKDKLDLPQSVDVRLAKSAILRILSRPDEALLCLDSLPAAGDPRIQAARGLALRDLKKHEAAATIFDSALSLSGTQEPELLICKASELWLCGKCTEANSMWQSVSLEPPSPPKARTLLGTNHAHDTGCSLALAGKYTESLPWFEAALRCSHHNPFTLRKKAVSLRLLNQYDEALQCLDIALESRQNDPDILHEKGLALSLLKKYDEALLCFDASLKIRPNYKETLEEKRLTEAAQLQCKIASAVASNPAPQPTHIPSERTHHPSWALSLVLEQEAHFRKSLHETQCFAAVIAVIGNTGSGKSSLINAVAQREVALTGVGKPVTKEPSRHIIDSNLVVYESPGTEGNSSAELPIILKQLFDLASHQNPPEEIHMVWWVISAADNRIVPKSVLDPCERLLIRPNGTRIPVLLVVNKFIPNAAGNILRGTIESDETRKFFLSVVYTNAVPDLNFVSTVFLCPNCKTTRMCCPPNVGCGPWLFHCNKCGPTSESVPPYNISALKEATILILPDVVKSGLKLQRLTDIRKTYSQAVSSIISLIPSIGVVNLSQVESRVSQHMIQISKLFGIKTSRQNELLSRENGSWIYPQQTEIVAVSPVVHIIAVCLLWATIIKRCQELLVSSSSAIGFRIGDVVANLPLVNNLLDCVKISVANFLKENREILNSSASESANTSVPQSISSSPKGNSHSTLPATCNVSTEKLIADVSAVVEQGLIPERFRDHVLAGVEVIPGNIHSPQSDETALITVLTSAIESTELQPQHMVGLVIMQPVEHPEATLSTFLKWCFCVAKTGDPPKVEWMLCFLNEWISQIPGDFMSPENTSEVALVLNEVTGRHFNIHAIEDSLSRSRNGDGDLNSRPINASISGPPETIDRVNQIKWKKIPEVLASSLYSIASKWTYVDWLLYRRVAKNPRSVVMEHSTERQELEMRIEAEELWTITQVLTSDRDEQKETIEACIELGLMFIKLNNHQAACSIASAFRSPILAPLVNSKAFTRNLDRENLNKLWRHTLPGDENTYPNISDFTDCCVPPISKYYTTCLEYKSYSLMSLERYALIYSLAAELKYFQSGTITIPDFPEKNKPMAELILLPHLSFSELEQKAQDCYVEARLLSGIATHHLYCTRLAVSIQELFSSKPVEMVAKEFSDSIRMLADMKSLKTKLFTTTETIYDQCIRQLSVGDAVSEDLISEIIRAELLVRSSTEIFTWCKGQVLPFVKQKTRCIEADKAAEALWARYKSSTPSDFGVEPEFWLGPSTVRVTTTLRPFQAAIDIFKSIKSKACPTEKAACVTNTAHAVFNFIGQLWEGDKANKRTVCGDTMACLFQYVIAQACVPSLFTELLIATELSSGPDSCEHDYYLTSTTIAAVALFLPQS